MVPLDKQDAVTVGFIGHVGDHRSAATASLPYLGLKILALTRSRNTEKRKTNFRVSEDALG